MREGWEKWEEGERGKRDRWVGEVVVECETGREGVSGLRLDIMGQHMTPL